MGKLSDKDKAYLLSLKPEDITFPLLIELFADKIKNQDSKISKIDSKIKVTDEFELKSGEYFNKEKVKTTAGQFIYNKLIIERDLKDILGYINQPLNGEMVKKIEGILSKALLNDNISVDTMVKYLDRTQWLSMKFHSVITGSFTMNTLKPNPNVIKTRNKLLKENYKKIKEGDVVTAAKIEKELLKVAEDELKGDTGLDLYKSGARGSFGNNFKNISIMKGPVINPNTGNYDIVQSNFMEGIRKTELSTYGNAIITGSYPKAVGTKVSGYFSKQIIAALQAVMLDKKGSDCETKGYLKIFLQENSIKDFLYRYIIEGNKLVLLDETNIYKYVNKEVKMRSPMFCISKKLCRVCAGMMYEKLNIDNIGLTAARVSSTLLNLSMKKFHDSTAKITSIKIEDIIL